MRQRDATGTKSARDPPWAEGATNLIFDIQAGGLTAMRMGRLLWLTDDQMQRLAPFFPNSRGRPSVDVRHRRSGIIFLNRNGLIWFHAPGEDGPPKTRFPRMKRWGDIGVFTWKVKGLAGRGGAETGVKDGMEGYRQSKRIEIMLGRSRHWHRSPARHDRSAKAFRSTVALAAIRSAGLRSACLLSAAVEFAALSRLPSSAAHDRCADMHPPLCQAARQALRVASPAGYVVSIARRCTP